MKVSEIRLVGRNSKGVKIMDLRKNDVITGASVVVAVEQPEVPEAEVAVGVPAEENVSAVVPAEDVPAENADGNREQE